MKETSVHIKNMEIKQLCNGKGRDFTMVFRARKRVFRETGPKLAISAIHRDRDGVSF